MEFLVLLAACPTARGDILELGPRRGKSTVLLALGASLADDATVVTVDIQSLDPLRENLRRVGVADRVEAHEADSLDFSREWGRPIRLFWHDGANTRDVARQDVIGLGRHLAPGGIIAFHDVLNTSGERVYAFCEEVLSSDQFGIAGVCGTIGWAQRLFAGASVAPYRRSKDRLRRRLDRLAPFQNANQDEHPEGLAKYWYKLLRSTVPHGRVEPAAWVDSVTRPPML
jgi:hypothetical protein